MVPEFPKQIARVSAVTTLIGSLIWVQWPVDFEKIDMAGLVMLVGSFFAWVSMELAEISSGTKSNENILGDDVEKINSIIKLIDQNQYYILKNKAIQTYMEDDDYDGLRILIDQHEQDIFPFHNQKIQFAYDAFCTECRDFFMDYYDLYTNNGRGRATWEPSGDGWVDDLTYRKIMSRIAALDRKTTSLALAWEGLIDLCRQELKGASKSIDRYELGRR